MFIFSRHFIRYLKKMNPRNNHNICKDYEELDSDAKKYQTSSIAWMFHKICVRTIWRARSNTALHSHCNGVVLPWSSDGGSNPCFRQAFISIF